MECHESSGRLTRNSPRENAVAGDRFYFDHQAQTGVPSLRWVLLDPFSNALFNGNTADVDPLMIAQTGTYTLLIEGHPNDTTVGTYTFNVQPLPPSSNTALTLNTTVNGAIGLTGEQDNFTFTLLAPDATQNVLSRSTNHTSVVCGEPSTRSVVSQAHDAWATASIPPVSADRQISAPRRGEGLAARGPLG